MTQFDDPETEDAMRSLASPKLSYTALAIASVPFFASLRHTETRSHTRRMPGGGIDIGETTVTSGIDYVAVAAGAIAITVAVYAVIQALRVRNTKVAGIGVAAIILGVVQVLRGTIWIA